MENRKIILDGVSYNDFTDEELEDFKTTIAYEEKKKNKDFKLIEFEDFIKEREENMGSNFNIKIDPIFILLIQKKTNLTPFKTLLLYML